MTMGLGSFGDPFLPARVQTIYLHIAFFWWGREPEAAEIETDNRGPVTPLNSVSACTTLGMAPPAHTALRILNTEDEM